MKKLNKLFAILIAVLGVQTLSAQTDVTSTYLTNADFSSTDGWTQYISGSYRDIGSGNIGGKLANYAASSTDATHLNSEYFFGFQCRWSGNYSSYNQETSQLLPAGVYTLSYDVQNVNGSTTAATYNNLFYVKVGEKTLSDASTEWMKGKSSWTSHSITFLITDPTKVTVSLGYGTGSNNIGTANTPVLYVSHLKLTYRGVDDINAENPADFTSLIKNPSFETGNLDGWTYKSSSDTGVKPNSDNTYKTSGVDGNYLYNTWWQGTPLTQTVGNIPNGIYELKVLLASDQNAKLFLLANDEHSEVYTITTDNKTFHDVSYEFKVLNGQAKIGVVGGNDAGEYVEAGHWWYKADNFRLIYKGADLSIEREAMDAALAKARAIDQATIPTVVAVSLNSAISTAENVENALNPIKAATNALLAVLATVDAVQAPYIETKALITSSNSMLTNSTASDADKATFQGVINKAEENLNDATDKATIDAIAVTIMDAQKAYCLVAAPTEGHPFVLTWLVVNPKFDEGTKGWTHTTGAPNWGIATNQGGEITGNYFENWKWESYTGEIYQELTDLPKGKYKLTAAAFRDQLIDGASDGDAVYVFANDVETLVNSATPAFYSVEVSTTTGSLRFGVKSKVAKYRWMGIDNVSLQFIEALDLSEFIAAYNIALEAAKAARDNAEYSNITGVEKTALLNAIANVPAETQESLSEATAALQSITAAFIAAKGDYDILDSEITVARNLGMTDDAINAITTTKTGAEAYPALKVAEYTYIYNTYTEDAPIGNWESQFDQIDGQSYDGTNVKYFDKWGDGTFALKQTVTLPKGDYAISVIARGQSGASGTLYYKIGEETTSTPLIMKNDTGFGVDINGVANFSSTGTYSNNNNGRGWEYRFITFHLDAETSVEIGVTATVNWQWASTYAPQLLTDPSSKKALLLTEIEHLLSNVPSGVMNAGVQNTLNATKAAAQGASNANTTAELNTIYADFKNAIDEANTSIDTYSKAPGYIAKAKAIGVALADDYQAQYDNRTLSGDAVTIFQNLEVATYSYVMSNFTYPVALSDTWNSTGTNTSAKEFNNEHWSGETRGYMNQNDDNGQGWNANAWSIDFDQSVTLPAGEYVFKVAGRKSAGSTLELVVTMGETILGTVNDFPASNNAKGINKAGVTSFDPEDEVGFANNGNGFGWQWRYVKFTLNAESTVKVAVHAEADEIHQWVSFGNYTLQMTEDTYLEANKGGLDAPTAAAQALVNAVPMGADEVGALNSALNLPVTTGQELLDKIEALNTAVANAKAWVTAYNEAKAPLVAALDRFEADYNNAENGALDYMNKGRWATAIEKAQAAAEAKDVTDSYDDFEAAANDLIAALDAATNSVNEYAALKSAIENANTLGNGGNWGDQPFQRPISAKENLNTTTAQATYDAAEADGEGVTSVTAALNENIEAVDAIVLNAPVEGARYNMVMSAGWEHDGKAVTYLAGGRNDAGLYNIQYYAAPNANYAQAFTFTAVEGKANCYTLSMTDVDGNERYVCTGVAYGGNTNQIRTTTDATQALAVKVIATTTDGIHQLYNTEANNYIGGQDAGFYTVNSHTTFRLQEAAKANVTLNLSKVGWATLILPFDAELPEGVKAWSCGEADGETLELDEVKDGKIKANTPYLMSGNPGSYYFSGYGLADKDSYEDGLFRGTYVDYGTKANSNTYVLQNIGGDAAFYLVGESGQPTVKPYRCYMVYEGAQGAPKFSFGRGEGTTSIENMEPTANSQQPIVFYDLMGRKVTTMEKGGMYIVNGKKVIVK